MATFEFRPTTREVLQAIADAFGWSGRVRFEEVAAVLKKGGAEVPASEFDLVFRGVHVSVHEAPRPAIDPRDPLAAFERPLRVSSDADPTPEAAAKPPGPKAPRAKK